MWFVMSFCKQKMWIKNLRSMCIMVFEIWHWIAQKCELVSWDLSHQAWKCMFEWWMRGDKGMLKSSGTARFSLPPIFGHIFMFYHDCLWMVWPYHFCYIFIGNFTFTPGPFFLWSLPPLWIRYAFSHFILGHDKEQALQRSRMQRKRRIERKCRSGMEFHIFLFSLDFYISSHGS